MKQRKAVVKIMPVSQQVDIAAHAKEILSGLGEDPSRDGLLKTPERYEKAMRFLTSGYQADVEKLINGALFDVDYDEMVVVKDIEFFCVYSVLCLCISQAIAWQHFANGEWIIIMIFIFKRQGACLKGRFFNRRQFFRGRFRHMRTWHKVVF